MSNSKSLKRQISALHLLTLPAAEVGIHKRRLASNKVSVGARLGGRAISGAVLWPRVHHDQFLTDSCLFTAHPVHKGLWIQPPFPHQALPPLHTNARCVCVEPMKAPAVICEQPGSGRCDQEWANGKLLYRLAPCLCSSLWVVLEIQGVAHELCCTGWV